ncbi:MAG: hypothetical protein KIT25_09110 [Enhydrobacter sp.]|nr:MAG: hypothetical protein KIT25_09110 [Enhydrobacter sp.]
MARKTPDRPFEVRFSRLHNLSIAAVAVIMLGLGLAHVFSDLQNMPRLSLNDPGFVLLFMLGAAMIYYVAMGLRRALDRRPQLVIDRRGITLGFGRDRTIAWQDVQWVRTRRIGLQRLFQFGIEPDAYVAADLRLAMWNFEDPMRPVRGAPTGVQMRDVTLDSSASEMLEAVRVFRPNLVKS